MSAPKLDLVSVEPYESGAVVYAPMAASAGGRAEQGRLILSLRIRNSEAAALQLRDLRVAVTAPGSVTEKTIPLTMSGNPVTIGSSGEAWWWFQGPAESVLFPSQPAPQEVRLDLRAFGFTDPASFAFPLRAHQAPTPSGAYLFPAVVTDLKGEYWFTNGNSHSVGPGGGFAYDLGVNARSGPSPWLKPRGDWARNEDYRVWGKGIHAMADGEVRHFLTEVPTNPKPLAGLNWNQEFAEQKAAVWGKWLIDNGFDPNLDEPHAGAGNHLYVQHGTEVVLYAHFQPGSIPGHLLQEGAPVAAGELLGLAGNSGNSSAPHLHVHAIRGTEAEVGPLRPLVFAPISVVESGLISPAPAPWVQAVAPGRSLPPVDTFIWPSAPPPFERMPEKLLIDPLSLLLSCSIYVKLKLPNPPPTQIMLGLVAQMAAGTPVGERREALELLHSAISELEAVAKTIEEGLG